MKAVVFIALFLTALAAFALAESPHFIGMATVTGVFANGGFGASFKEAGLGNAVETSYVLAAKMTADYGCVNHGGNHPQAANKETLIEDVSVEGTFTSNKNGNVVGGLTFTPPSASDELFCPGNQMAVLADIAYTDITLADITNDDLASLDKTALSAIFFNF